MRHELCLDNRNEPKWSATLNSANRIDACAIVYAAMYVPDVGGDGDQCAPWQGQAEYMPILPVVQQFFAGERLRAGHEDGRRNLWRIAHLDPRITCVTDTYSSNGQSDYIQKILSLIGGVRTDTQRLVVLLDPCNGVADGRGNRDNQNLRIHSGSVASIWAGMATGDALVIWPWPLPERIPAHNPVDLLATSLDIPREIVRVHPFGPFAMLELEK
jgi:hypothetical protein